MNLLIQKAKDMQGWLEKKGGLSWQKRYFMIVESDQNDFVLAYFEKSNDQKPKGSIALAEIGEIIAEGDREFVLQYPTKNFRLLAANPNERSEWMQALVHLKKFAQQQRELPRTGSTDSSSSSSLRRTGSSSSSGSPVKRTSFLGISRKSITPGHKNIDSFLLSKICAQKEQRGVSSTESEKVRPYSAEEIFEKLGLQQYIDAIKPTEVMTNRLVYGYLKKMSKSKQKSGYTRFFLLISQKPLYSSKGYTDESLLKTQDLQTCNCWQTFLSPTCGQPSLDGLEQAVLLRRAEDNGREEAVEGREHGKCDRGQAIRWARCTQREGIQVPRL